MIISKGEERLLSLLRETFPFTRIIEQYYVYYAGQKLYFDFYLPAYSLVIEFQGNQHYEFVEFFHQDNDGWRLHKKRDMLKKDWVFENEMNLLEINDTNFPGDVNELLDIVINASK